MIKECVIKKENAWERYGRTILTPFGPIEDVNIPRGGKWRLMIK